MLLLIDLDNTLVDRASAFNSWAKDFVRSLGFDEAEAAWLIEFDRDGYTPREALASAIKSRFELEFSIAELVDKLLFDHVFSMVLEESVKDSLALARSLGWQLVIVTNGTTAQQSLKIRNVDLEALVDAVIISESEGVKKPDRLIFERAAARVDADLEQAWMIGDHPIADIDGARALGMKTAWVSRGLVWPEADFMPDLIAPTVDELIHQIVALSSSAKN